MKKQAAAAILSALLICILAGCGDQTQQAAPVRSNPQSVLPSGPPESIVTPSGPPESVPAPPAASEPESPQNSAEPEGKAEPGETPDSPKPPEITPDGASPDPQTGAEALDVDLTALSSTMVYAEVYNMMTAPEDYIGKIVKMKGEFAIYHDEAADQYYFAVIITDATACCAQGIEFIWAGEHTYPDDYPELGNEVTVTGEFRTYEEGGYTYIHLIDADLSF